MRSPGVELQPIKTATGESHFNEVFLNDVFVPDEMLLGGPTDGWSLAIATMAEERLAISGYVKFDRAGVLRRLAAEPGPDRDDAERRSVNSTPTPTPSSARRCGKSFGCSTGRPSGPASSIAKVAMNVLAAPHVQGHPRLTGQTAMVDRLPNPRSSSRTCTCRPN